VLSVVVPTLDEQPRIRGLVLRLLSEADEVVVSDGGSTDGTTAAARAAGARVVEGPPGRGPQLDRGASAAAGDVLWFLHADAEVPGGLGRSIRRAAEGSAWGCCETHIDSADPRLRWTGWVMTRRARLTGAMTGDMGIWARRSLFEGVGGFGSLPALEDLDFSDRARRAAPWALVGPALGTSARRWTGEGVTRTMARMLALRVAYRFGVAPDRLARWYRSAPR
jgi:rSAM/selenodomain-associated transferase 2